MEAWRVAEKLNIDLDDLLAYLAKAGVADIADVTPLTDEQIRRIESSRDAITSRAAPADFVAAEQELLEFNEQLGDEPQDHSEHTWAAPSAEVGSSESAPEAIHSEEDPMEEVWAEVLRDAKRPILLWGPPASGKSTFLSSLLLPDWGANLPDAKHRWEVVGLGARTAQYVGELRESLDRGTPPPATSTTEPPYKFRIRKKLKSKRVLGFKLPERIQVEANLLFLDPSGELFTVARMGGKAGERVLQLFGKAAGLLLLIDPGPVHRKIENQGTHSFNLLAQHHNEHRYAGMLSQNISTLVHWAKSDPERRERMLDRDNRLVVPTAICVTKMDQHLNKRDNVSDFLKQELGNAYDMLQHSFTDLAVYACSALGNEVEVSADGNRISGVAKPWGIFEPIDWVLKHSKKAQS